MSNKIYFIVYLPRQFGSNKVPYLLSMYLEDIERMLRRGEKFDYRLLDPTYCFGTDHLARMVEGSIDYRKADFYVALKKQALTGSWYIHYYDIYGAPLGYFFEADYTWTVKPQAHFSHYPYFIPFWRFANRHRGRVKFFNMVTRLVRDKDSIRHFLSTEYFIRYHRIVESIFSALRRRAGQKGFNTRRAVFFALSSGNLILSAIYHALWYSVIHEVVPEYHRLPQSLKIRLESLFGINIYPSLFYNFVHIYDLEHVIGSERLDPEDVYQYSVIVDAFVTDFGYSVLPSMGVPPVKLYLAKRSGIIALKKLLVDVLQESGLNEAINRALDVYGWQAYNIINFHEKYKEAKQGGDYYVQVL